MPYSTLVRCSAVLSIEEAQRIEEQRNKEARLLTREDELVAKVVKKLMELDPNLVNRALQESGAISEIKKLKAGVS